MQGKGAVFEFCSILRKLGLSFCSRTRSSDRVLEDRVQQAPGFLVRLVTQHIINFPDPDTILFPRIMGHLVSHMDTPSHSHEVLGWESR